MWVPASPLVSSRPVFVRLRKHSDVERAVRNGLLLSAEVCVMSDAIVAVNVHFLPPQTETWRTRSAWATSNFHHNYCVAKQLSLWACLECSPSSSSIQSNSMTVLE